MTPNQLIQNTLTPEALVIEALVIGAGPAGLMAAEMLSAAGHKVLIAEAMPTPARKFLMAGKSGLNLTKNEPRADFLSRFASGQPSDSSPADWLGLEAFGPAEVKIWAEGLGIALFTGSTGRVFPVGMKGSPLLRAWLSRLSRQGVEIRNRWRWTGETGQGFAFETPDGPQQITPKVAVLALGGASWPRLGSDAGWLPVLTRQDIDIAPFKPANMGFRVTWSEQMARHIGQAVKGVAVHAAGQVSRGEWVISAAGIEGGGIYEIAAPIRDGAEATVDLAPDLKTEDLAARFATAPKKLSLGNRLRRVLGDPVRAALLMEWGRPLPSDPAALARLAKSLPLRHEGALPIERAISSAGGIRASALRPGLELANWPGVFVAGEMLDWEAPTGGYLLTGCLASGKLAGESASAYLASAAR